MRQAHVVILTAVALEYRAARQVDAGAWEGSQWEEEPGPNGLPVAFRTFRGKGGRACLGSGFFGISRLISSPEGAGSHVSTRTAIDSLPSPEVPASGPPVSCWH
ncbi:MAG TPA: hypothetical protein VNA24_07800 [Hyalangium sp.]|nr:hypothetical protein [Hyalangium sp.]